MRKLLLLLILIICSSDVLRASRSFPTTGHVLQVIDSLHCSRFSAASRDYWGSTSFSKGDYKEAMELFRASATAYDKLHYPVAYANALRNMGRTYLMLSRQDSAVCYYLQALENVARYDVLLFMDVASELSEIFRVTDSWENAQQRMLTYRKQQAMDQTLESRFANGMFIQENDFVRGKKEILADLERASSNVKDYKQFASHYQELFDNWGNLNRELQLVDRELKHKYKNEVLKNENQRMQNELLQRRIWLLSLATSMVFLVGVGFVLFTIYHRRIRLQMNSLILRLQENELCLLKGEIASEEEHRKLLEENETLIVQINQLSMRQRDKDKWNAYLQKQNIEYSKQLKSFERIGMTLSPEYALALSQLYSLHTHPSVSSVKCDEEWEVLFTVVNFLYGDISSRLDGKKLSIQERRICYLLHAGFNNKMIAEVSNVTIEAISKAKQRMKSKFSLMAGDSLDDFICN